MAPRGKTIPVEPWWVDEAIVRIENDPERTVPEVGKALGVAVERTAFSRSFLSRFLNRDKSTKITLEFTQAVCSLYDMPPPVLFPRSREEALDLARKASEYPDDDPNRAVAHKKHVDQLEQHLKRLKDQMPSETVAQVEQRLREQAKRAAAAVARRRSKK
jgi:hypothetical protein